MQKIMQSTSVPQLKITIIDITKGSDHEAILFG